MVGPALLGEHLREHRGRKTLVLDLDETLIHSVFKPVDNADIVCSVPSKDGGKSMIYVYKRPGVDMFLRRLSKLYEVCIFTASI